MSDEDLLKLVLSIVPSLIQAVYDAVKTGSTAPLGGLQALLDAKAQTSLVKAAADRAAQAALKP